MVIQHNLSAMGANEANRKNTLSLKKKTEKLSTGYKINRAADNASGLSVSEKMRSQINGLSQATCNSNDAASLIQTAEGGLQESEDIIQRIRELAVQAANGTYTDDDRQQIQYEIDALKCEVDRISESTEFNNIKLLDGSKAGVTLSNEYGARYGIIADESAGSLAGAILTSSIAGVNVVAVPGASGRGGENAAWSEDGRTLTMNLTPGEYYPQSRINDIINNASREKCAPAAPADITLTFDPAFLNYRGDIADTGVTVPGVRSTGSGDLRTLVNPARDPTDGQLDSADKITFTANTYGKESDIGYAHTIEIRTDVGAGEETIDVKDCDAYEGAKDLTLHLATGVTYTESDFENLLAKAGFDYSVDLSDQADPDGDSDCHIRFLYSASKPLKETVSFTRSDNIQTTESEPVEGTVYYSYQKVAITAFGGNGTDYLTKDSSGIYSEVRNGTAFNPNETYYVRTWTPEDVSNGFDPDKGYWKQEKQVSMPNTIEWSFPKTQDVTPVEGKTYYVYEYKEETLSGTGFLEGVSYYYKNDNGDYVRNGNSPFDPSKTYYTQLTKQADVSNGFEDGKTYYEYVKKVKDGIGTLIELSGGQGVGYEDLGKNGEGLIFQIGANGVEDQKLYVTIDDMSAKALGVSDIVIDPLERAREAIAKAREAIEKLSAQRAKLGAVQNRLEHTTNSLNTANENLTAAESQIRDTDMAVEMTAYTRDNILQQASQAMLAQANQQLNGVLSLLG